ncbi:MAG: rhodanese-like domain-containing protein, partial [Nitrospinota bacterium]|nr:rhodanese-like domain-containing protein [Nitrospinota bacterium]
MRWKQFFTPVQSINASQGKQFISERSLDSITILDVRQHSEYEKEHLPGAKWIPLPELDVRVDELDVNKDIIVY